ncbi:MAG: LacI family transcriptional regulator [Chitinophagaceae bacterium]|nr:MAG: LacI family transcriptional regulator [Chitinophagaceae bacterium]
MKYEAITIKDIAKALGLATSTVSRALKGSYEISADTKKLVLDYAEKINYRPNPIALSLKEKRSRAIGVVVCEIANTFFSQVINGIESIAYDRGYYVIISQSHESYDREVLNTRHLASRSVDGLLVSLSTETTDMSHFHSLHDKGLPIVFFDRVCDTIDTHKVIADNFKGAYDATVHLLGSGFKKIAHITSSPNISITRERLAGYRRALEENGIPYEDELVKYCAHGGLRHDELEAELADLMSQRVQPDAILAASDRISMGAMAWLTEQNISIPGQIALVGFTNSQQVGILSPALTAVTQPAFEMGRIATEKLIDIIESKQPIIRYDTTVLKTEFTIRQSSL